MKVSTNADGLWQDDSGSIDGLVYAIDITSSGDFLDQYRGESFVPKSLVDAEEVDLGRFERLGSYTKSYWNTGYECDQLFGLGDADSDMPLLAPAWRFQRPMLFSFIIK